MLDGFGSVHVARIWMRRTCSSRHSLAQVQEGEVPVRLHFQPTSFRLVRGNQMGMAQRRNGAKEEWCRGCVPSSPNPFLPPHPLRRTFGLRRTPTAFVEPLFRPRTLPAFVELRFGLWGAEYIRHGPRVAGRSPFGHSHQTPPGLTPTHPPYINQLPISHKRNHAFKLGVSNVFCICIINERYICTYIYIWVRRLCKALGVNSRSKVQDGPRPQTRKFEAVSNPP